MSIKNKTKLLDIDKVISRLDLEPRQKVAELGCGKYGFFTFPLAKIVGKYGLVYAVDIIKDYLTDIDSRAREDNLDQIKTVWSNLEIYKGTKIETSSLDFALLINVLHQSDKPLSILEEAKRMLKTKAKLLIIDWDQVDTPIGPALENRIKLNLLKQEALKLGFEVEETFKAGSEHYGLILRKL